MTSVTVAGLPRPLASPAPLLSCPDATLRLNLYMCRRVWPQEPLIGTEEMWALCGPWWGLLARCCSIILARGEECLQEQ